MMRKYSQWKFGVVLGVGALVALVLCVQCVRTYFYIDTNLIPQQAEHEAARQIGSLSAAARSAGITDPRNTGPVVEHAVESAADRILWMRVLDVNGTVFSQAGTPEGRPQVPSGWWQRVEQHDRLGTPVNTRQGKAWVVMLPLRLPHPLHRPGDGPDDRRNGYVIEVAISMKAVSAAFDGLRQNLVLGLTASIGLLISLTVIGLRAPHYVRGKYLEKEMELARSVQSALQPKPQPVSSCLEFAASSIAADHVCGDFYDIFEAESGRIGIVLGDVSGKGVPAALLVSVLHGAIRSSTTFEHELACERVNRMLCERTACERFATLFWGVFDPAKQILRYVNAGHGAPILIRDGQVIRLTEGGPVLGLLPNARYSVGSMKMEASDRLILCSDGISEAMNEKEEEFGEKRVMQMAKEAHDPSAAHLCERILAEVTAFGSSGEERDDRTLMIVQFRKSAITSAEAALMSAVA
jgi:hypothetical protein